MIKIVRGVYGFMDKDGIVRPKTAADAPFTLQAEQEARLVNLGVAEYVGSIESVQDSISVDDAPTEEPALSELSVKELREIGKEYGLTFKIGTSKADMVRAIEAAEAELDAEAEDDGEPVPVFDASEAVL